MTKEDKYKECRPTEEESTVTGLMIMVGLASAIALGLAVVVGVLLM